MVDLLKYERLLEEGLILDHYFLLLSIRDSKEILLNKRVKGFIGLLTKKEYIFPLKINGVYQLTGLALELLQDEIPVCVTTTTSSPPIDFGEWITSLHKKCQDKLKELTGSTQVTARINRGKGYPFLPNPTDLGKVIVRVINNYKLKNLEEIEKQILSYIETSKYRNEWFPLLKYYIMKDGQSQMVTEMSSVEEKQVVKSTQRHI